jgi:hypothetical protein
MLVRMALLNSTPTWRPWARECSMRCEDDERRLRDVEGGRREVEDGALQVRTVSMTAMPTAPISA